MGSVFGFAGEQTDAATGHQYLRARYHDPTTGRFLSADTVQPNAPGTQGYNRYSYTADNPTTWTDPSGHALPSIGEVRAGFVSTVLLGVLAVTAAGILAAGPQVAYANAAGGSTAVPMLTGTELAALSGPLVGLVTALRLAFVGWVAVHLGGSIVDRAIGAGMALFGLLIGLVLFQLIGSVFAYLASWNFYTDVTAPTNVVSLPPSVIRTAQWQYPLGPLWENCARGAVQEVSEDLIWTGLLLPLIGLPSANDLLASAAVGCILGFAGSRWSGSNSQDVGAIGQRQASRALDENGFSGIVPNRRLNIPTGGHSTRRWADFVAEKGGITYLVEVKLYDPSGPGLSTPDIVRQLEDYILFAQHQTAGGTPTKVVLLTSRDLKLSPAIRAMASRGDLIVHQWLDYPNAK